MAAPKTENKAIDDQTKSGSEFMVQVNVGLAGFEATSHDPDNLSKITGLMNGDGSWSTTQTDHDGNVNNITHGAEKSAAQATHEDVSGGHAVKRVAGGSHDQMGNGSNKENGEAETNSVKGPAVTATESSGKNYSKGGDGQTHHKGDMTFSVEEGGIHYNVSKDFTVTATGKLIHMDSAGDTSFKTKVNETHDVQGKTTFFSVGDVKITSTSSIVLQVGGSTLTMTPSGITIVASRIDLNP